MGVRKLRSENAESLAQGLANAESSSHVAKLLTQAKIARVPHAALVELGVSPVLPGYRYSPEGGRFIRRKVAGNVGEIAVDVTLTGVATAAYTTIVRSGYQSRVNRLLDGWRQSGARNVPARQLAVSMSGEMSVAEKAMLVRNAMTAELTILNSSNTQGSWAQLPNGNLGGKSAVDVLSHEYPQQTGARSATGLRPMWMTIAGADTPLVVRRQPLLGVAHQGLPVAQYDEKGRAVIQGVAERTYKVFQDTVFALDPEAADTLAAEHDFLEELYHAHGDGYEREIVPAAGFLVVRQDVQISPVAG